MTLKLPERKCHWKNNPSTGKHMEVTAPKCRLCDGSQSSGTRLRCNAYLPLQPRQIN